MPCERRNVGADAALFRFGAEKVLPLPHRDHEARLAGLDGQAHAAVQVNHGTDIARGKFVGGNRLVNRRLHLLGRHGQFAKAHDVCGIQQAFDVFVHAEHGRPFVGRVAADAFKTAEAVLHRCAHKRDHAFAGGP
jgi:hypothetical protein